MHVKVLYYTISCIELFLRFHYILLADYPNQDLARYVFVEFRLPLKVEHSKRPSESETKSICRVESFVSVTEKSSECC